MTPFPLFTILLASDAGDGASGVIGLLIFCVIVASIIAFFKGPASAAERHAAMLAQNFKDPADGVLFFNIYRSKKPRSTLVAWLLTIFLSPSIAYVYQQRWAPAIISFVTLQGLGLWWVVSLFTMPLEVARANKHLADEAYNQVMLARPQGGHVATTVPPPPSINPAPSAPFLAP